MAKGRMHPTGGIRMSTPAFTTVLYAATVFSVVLLPSPMEAQGGQEQADTSESFIEIRHARQAAAQGFRRATVLHSGRAVYVGSEKVFTDEDFEEVGTRAMPSGIVLRARWETDAAERWVEIRRGGAAGGDFLAVFINGELVAAPRIVVDPQATGTPDIPLDIGVQVPDDKAESIAEAVAARWPGGGY